MDKRKSSLPKPHQRLVDLMQQINFGRLENLVVADGQVVMDPPPRVVREIKFGSENGARRELSLGDFALKAQVVELMQYIDDLQDGEIDVLEIKGGLPFRMILREVAA
jgi:hypothetical protein